MGIEDAFLVGSLQSSYMVSFQVFIEISAFCITKMLISIKINSPNEGNLKAEKIRNTAAQFFVYLLVDTLDTMRALPRIVIVNFK